jgi:hypothetical protein
MAALETVPAGENTQRAFRGDMDMVRPELFDAPADLAGRRQRQPDVGIGRHRDGAEFLWGQEIDGIAGGNEVVGQMLQRAHHAVDLRMPGIGDDQDSAEARIAGNGILHRLRPCIVIVRSMRSHARHMCGFDDRGMT